MILLKAMGKTLLSILKFILIFSICIGVLVGIMAFATAVQFNPTLQNITASIACGAFAILVISAIIFTIVETTKDNYEKYAIQSKNPTKKYSIQYNKIYYECRVVEGKTKHQAINHLYERLAESKTGNDYVYKIKKIRRW